MGHSDIDAAVEREMRRQAESEPYPDDPNAGEYGDRGECAVCGRPLDKPPQPEGLQFCDEHDAGDLRARDRDIAEHALEHLAGTQREDWDI